MSSTKELLPMQPEGVRIAVPQEERAAKQIACKHCNGFVSETKAAILPKGHDVLGPWCHLTCIAFCCKAEILEAIPGFKNLKKKDRDVLKENLVVEQQEPEQQEPEEEEEQARREQVRVRELWNEHSQKVINNMHKLAKLTYHDLARKLEMDVDVLKACVRHYFDHEVYISEEVASMGKAHPGNKSERFTGKTNKDEYPTDVEVTLHEAMQVVSLTKEKSFQQICSDHKMSLENIRYDVNFVISFGKSILGKQ